MGFDDGCNTGLVLGLGFASAIETTTSTPTNKANNINIINHHQLQLPKGTCFEPSLSLGLPGEIYPEAATATATATTKKTSNSIDVNKGYEESAAAGVAEYQILNRQASPHSAVSNSFSSGRVVKRERDLSSEEIEVEKVISSRASDEDEDGVNARKKLRLTKEQSALLEESFKQHSTLNPKQKQALARQLNLRPRQVEVWFQNRRARTKLKQTEVDCEFLKKCCETLTDENRRLHKELQELKTLKLAQPLYMHMPAATLTMCPSCERIGGGIADGNSKGPFPMGTKPHCYSPFTNPSAAC